MRLRHVITQTDRSFRDFTNNGCEIMHVGYDPIIANARGGTAATHRTKGGWRYRLDLLGLFGGTFVKVTGLRDNGQGEVTKKELFVPANSFKEIHPWTDDDEKGETADLARLKAGPDPEPAPKPKEPAKPRHG